MPRGELIPVPRLMRSAINQLVHIENTQDSRSRGAHGQFVTLCMGQWERPTWTRSEGPPTCRLCILKAQRRLLGLQRVLMDVREMS